MLATPVALPCAAVCAPFKNSPYTYQTCCKQHPRPKVAASRPVTQLPKPAARPGQIKKVSSITKPELGTLKGLGDLAGGTGFVKSRPGSTGGNQTSTGGGLGATGTGYTYTGKTCPWMLREKNR